MKMYRVTYYRKQQMGEIQITEYCFNKRVKHLVEDPAIEEFVFISPLCFSFQTLKKCLTNKTVYDIINT